MAADRQPDHQGDTWDDLPEPNYRIVEHVPCESATEFLDSISHRSKFFCDFQPNAILYRGHEDARYRLVPSALRLENQHLVLGSIPDKFKDSQPQNWISFQAQGECFLIRRFFRFADIAGLPLPEDSLTYRKLLEDVFVSLISGNSGGRKWPQSELLSLIALAQHYGIPTSLLDWTWSPFKAAYFAAAGVLSESSGSPDKDSKELAVWAMSSGAVTSASVIHAQRVREEFASSPTEISLDELEELQRGFPLEIVTVPRAGNPNLHAQEGVFTLFRRDDLSGVDDVDRTPLDDALSNHPSVKRTYRDHSLLYHFTLSASKADMLMWLLAKEGITAATLYPGFQGAARAVLESQKLLRFGMY